MGPLGIPELIIIFVVALIVFGPRKLPELGRSLGKSLSEFKRASTELRSTLDDEIRLEDRRAAASAQTPPPASTPPAPAEGEASGAAASPDTTDTPTMIGDDEMASDTPADTVARGGSRA